MKILAHRGYWNGDIPNNSLKALKEALNRGYGFESDIRDFNQELVISHNIADGNSQKAEDVFSSLTEHNDKFCFAINIKSDGLIQKLKELLIKYRISNYFTFDMSVPQMIEYSEAGLTFFTRLSEYEKEPVLYERALGVWVDAFEDDSWLTEELVLGHIHTGKTICIVSPDLHKRPYKEFWGKIKQWQIDFSKLMLCTDHPDEARAFFMEIVD